MRITFIAAVIVLLASNIYAIEKRGDMVTRVQPVTSPALTIQRTNATDASDGMVFDIKGDYQAQIVADAPTFYWKLDGDYVDAMGLATTGTASVGVFGVAKYGTASAIMNGTNGYINISHNTSMNFSTNVDFSVEYWVKLSGSPSIGTNYQVISHTSTGSNGFYTGVINNAGIYGWFFNIGAISYVSTAITIDSNWHYIVFVLNRSNSVTLYVDGISQIISGIPNQNTDVTNQLTIGGRSFTQPLRVVFGSIDEVAIYRRMLTQAEVTKHYLNGTKSRMTFTNSGTISGVSVTVSGEIHSLHTLTANNVDTFGTTTSYSSFEPDGTLSFIGNATVWNDINIPLAGAKVPAVNAPTWTTYSTNLNSYTFAVNDFADLASSEIPHSYKQGTNIDVHTHIVTRSSDGASRTVKYVAYYSWGNPSSTMSSEASITGEATISASTPTFTHVHVDIGTISGATTSIGAMLKLRLKRIASSVAEPALDPFVEQVGVHYEQDTVGSRQEVIK